MLVFAGLLRLWLWVRFAPVLLFPRPPEGAKGVDAVALPIALDWVFLIMAAHTLYRISGIDRKTKAFRWFAWLATALAVVHLPYALTVPDLLKEGPSALVTLSVDLPVVLLLLAIYRWESRGKPQQPPPGPGRRGGSGFR